MPIEIFTHWFMSAGEGGAVVGKSVGVRGSGEHRETKSWRGLKRRSAAAPPLPPPRAAHGLTLGLDRGVARHLADLGPRHRLGVVDGVGVSAGQGEKTATRRRGDRLGLVRSGGGNARTGRRATFGTKARALRVRRAAWGGEGRGGREAGGQMRGGDERPVPYSRSSLQPNVSAGCRWRGGRKR